MANRKNIYFIENNSIKEEHLEVKKCSFQLQTKFLNNQKLKPKPQDKILVNFIKQNCLCYSERDLFGEGKESYY